MRRLQDAPVAVAFCLGQEVAPLLLQGVDAVVHCAYDFGPRRWKEIFAVNVVGSEKLFAAARDAGVKSIIHISSLSAFPGCRSLYGRAKLETERLALAVGALVIRPGLVYGDSSEGMFGRLVTQVRSSSWLPVIHGGQQTQYTVHEEDLGELVLGCLAGRAGNASIPILAAHARGWELGDILRQISNALGKQVRFIPVPWQIIWIGLKLLETAGIPTRFRSDSLISLIYQDPQPSFALLKSLGFHCRPFQLTAGMLGQRSVP
jgi:nucleoside-diphosphate-sugar epimerase